MDRELLAHVLREWPEEVAAQGESGDHAGPLMTFIVERLRDCPAVVFSRFGEVLAQTPAAIALFGDQAREDYLVHLGVTDHGCLERCWHPELGGLELYRRLLLDPVACQILLVFTAVPGSGSEEKLRLLAAADD